MRPSTGAKGWLMKLLHTADLHLDSPFSALGLEEAQARRQGQRELLKRIFDCAREENCDLILMAGDVFDDRYVTPETEALFLELLERTPCQVVISPGNHDPFVEGSFYQKNTQIERLHVFAESALSYFDFPQWNTRVYGYAFRGQSMQESPLSFAEPASEGAGIRLLCAHGDLMAPLSKYGPITISDIVKFDIKYAALGHVHKAPEPVVTEGAWIGYSGIPEGRSFDETGEGGVWIVTVEEGGVVACERRILSERSYVTAELDVTSLGGEEEILSAIKKEAERHLNTKGAHLRLRLVGSMDPRVSFRRLVDSNPSVELRNETVPSLSGESLKQDVTIRGALYRTLYPSLISGDREERLRALRALQIGLAAIDERDIPSEEDLT